MRNHLLEETCRVPAPTHVGLTQAFSQDLHRKSPRHGTVAMGDDQEDAGES